MACQTQESKTAAVEKMVAHCEHVLPGQRPLDAFVHHNTLHSFEHLSFEEGVEKAAILFGANPYPQEDAFRQDWKSGRIRAVDLDAVLKQRVDDSPLGFGAPGMSKRDAVRALMLGLQRSDGGHSLHWRITESKELSEFPDAMPRVSLERLRDAGPIESIQQALWQICETQCDRSPLPNEAAVRPRDWILQEKELDPDTLVHPLLIRWCGAYLDGGQCYWPMGQRDLGFFTAMLHYFSAPGPVLRPWTLPLGDRAQSIIETQTSAAQCIIDTAARMGVPDEHLESLIEKSLLAMPGWPGMFVQLKARPDLAPAPMPPTELIDYVAIRLLVDEAAARFQVSKETGVLLPPGAQLKRTRRKDPAWILFSAARLLGVLPEEAERNPNVLRQLTTFLEDFSDTKRRALWLLAYERRYRHLILDGILNHTPRVQGLKFPKPKAQIVTCIDDREESLRRHLEEIDPHYETFGAAGFYGVAMYYQNLGNPHHTPLCPANVVPTHLIKEKPVDPKQWAKKAGSYSRQGWLKENISVGQNTLLRGGLISLWGWSSIIPMATRLLAPRLYGKISSGGSKGIPTRLEIEAAPTPVFEHGFQVGYTVDEMINIVARYLEDIGLTQDFAPLVIFLGHGSRSMNNPHEAAHDCGACGGGRGGPNARAFAMMANRKDVRAALAEIGITIPEETWFIGGYHNTADDEIEYFDLDLIPEQRKEGFDAAKKDLDKARELDAHERCRRFESAPLNLAPKAALQHVENRVEDLAQPRPEYGHCTNALCIVGKRAWNRGLFLDRRVFLQSYDPAIDEDSAILERILAMVGPVGAGISLEYYFSFVDPDRYGSSTKLPHNVTGLLGVMNGPSSDLRTGLPWQMVEIHEPMRLLNIIEAHPQQLLEILERQPALKALVVNRWILIVAYDPQEGKMWFFDEEGFVPYEAESHELPERQKSGDWYGGRRDHLPPATLTSGFPERELS